MKRLIAALLAAATLLLCGCTANQTPQFSVTYYDVFDTVVTLTAQTDSEAAFNETAERVHSQLQEYHKLFDIYNNYQGLINLYIINETAHIGPVRADSRIIDLLLYCKEVYAVTHGKVNAAMGAVLMLWHQARTAALESEQYAFLPEKKVLDEAVRHTDFDDVIIDQAASTVYIADPMLILDVGAIAKGWAVEQIAKTLPSGWLINAGGNVVATGPKADGSPWKVAVQDPDNASAYLHTLSVSGGCVVTSGYYERQFVYDGQLYHHIIDPDTLYPAKLWNSVTVVCDNSAHADMLSTALFLMDRWEGQKLLTQYGAEALWVDTSGEKSYSPGFEKLIAK